MKEKHHCKNCNTELQGNYCQSCGQKSIVGRFTMRAVLHSMVHGIFHCDRNILHTYYALFTHPGKMIAGYINGCRIRYFNPFTMLVITAGIVTVVSEILLAEHIKSAPIEASGTVLSRLWHHLATVRESPAFTAIALIFLFTFAAKLVTRWIPGKKHGIRYNYTELLVAGVYIACQCLAAHLLVEMPLQLILGKDHIDYFNCIYLVFWVWDCKQLFQLSVKKSILLVFLCFLTVIAALVLLILFLTLIYS